MCLPTFWNRPFSQIPHCIWSIRKPIIIPIWIVHCEIWERFIVGFVNLVHYSGHIDIQLTVFNASAYNFVSGLPRGAFLTPCSLWEWLKCIFLGTWNSKLVATGVMHLNILVAKEKLKSNCLNLFESWLWKGSSRLLRVTKVRYQMVKAVSDLVKWMFN